MHWNVNLKELKKSWRFWFSSYSSRKSKKYPFDSRCSVMRTKVAWEDVGAGKNGAKVQVALEYYGEN
jgi:hypothetical protein